MKNRLSVARCCCPDCDVYSDDFSGTLGDWTETTGVTIVSNEMRFDLVSSTEESAYLNTADTGNLKVIFDAKAAWEGAILEFRADKDDTRYYRFLWDDDNGEAIISIIDDTDGIIQSIAWQLEKDVWYELCFCCASTHVAIEVDGTHILTDPQGKTVDNPEIKVKANTAFTGQYLYVDDFELRDTSEEQSGCPVCPDEDDEETDEDPDDDVTCKTTVCAGVNVPHRLLVVFSGFNNDGAAGNPCYNNCTKIDGAYILVHDGLCCWRYGHQLGPCNAAECTPAEIVVCAYSNRILCDIAVEDNDKISGGLCDQSNHDFGTAAGSRNGSVDDCIFSGVNLPFILDGNIFNYGCKAGGGATCTITTL